MNLVLHVVSPFTADLQIPNSDRVSGVALRSSLLVLTIQGIKAKVLSPSKK